MASITFKVVLQEGGHLGEEDQIHIEIEVLQMMSGRQHGAVDVLIMNMMMSGGAHQMNDFLNGVMMIAMILIPLVLLIHLEHLFHIRFVLLLVFEALMTRFVKFVLTLSLLGQVMARLFFMLTLLVYLNVLSVLSLPKRY